MTVEVGGSGASVAVDVGVDVAVDVGVGVGGSTVNLGVWVPGAGEAAVRDGDGFAVVGEKDAGAAGGGTLVDGGALVDGDSPGEVAPTIPASPLAGALAEPGELPDPAAACRGACDPVSASTVTIPVAMIATRTPAAAATPDSASIRRLGGRTACGKPLGRNAPARCATARRYDSASGLLSAHRVRISSRSPGGGSASGAMP